MTEASIPHLFIDFATVDRVTHPMDVTVEDVISMKFRTGSLSSMCVHFPD